VEKEEQVYTLVINGLIKSCNRFHLEPIEFIRKNRELSPFQLLLALNFLYYFFKSMYSMHCFKS
jgi:hypothetical protein